MSGPNLPYTLIVVIATLVVQIKAQGTCTADAWTLSATSTEFTGTKALISTHTTAQQCQTGCVGDSNCVSVEIDTSLSNTFQCQFNTDIIPLLTGQTGFTQYQYGRSCTATADSQTCAFTYQGQYQMTTVANTIATVTATSLTECLTKCITSTTCIVASYNSATTECLHAITDASARGNRVQLPNWAQYIKGSCSTTPTVAPTVTAAPTTLAPTLAPTTLAPTTLAPTTLAPTTAGPTIPTCPAGTSNVWTTFTNQHIVGGIRRDSFQTVATCQAGCVANLDCNAIDFNPNNVADKCYFLLGSTAAGTKAPEIGTNHYSLARCTGPSTPSPTTPSPSTPSPSTVSPSTPAPSTVVPSTLAPVTSTPIPSTAAPTTIQATPSTTPSTTTSASTTAPSTTTSQSTTTSPSTTSPSTTVPSTTTTPGTTTRQTTPSQTAPSSTPASSSSSTASASSTPAASTRDSSTTSGCTRIYQEFVGLHGLSGAAVNGVVDMTVCRAACNLQVNCTAYDFDSNLLRPARCFLFLGPFVKEGTNSLVAHYNYTSSCIATATTRVTTPTTSPTTSPTTRPSTSTTTVTTPRSSPASSTAGSSTPSSTMASSTTASSTTSSTTVASTTTSSAASTTAGTTTRQVTTRGTSPTVRVTTPTSASTTVSTTQATSAITATAPSGCVQYGQNSIRWIRHDNHHGLGGSRLMDTMLGNCLSRCGLDTTCRGFDILTTNNGGKECWGHFQQSNIDNRAPFAATLYVKENCAASTVTVPIATATPGCDDIFDIEAGSASALGEPIGIRVLDLCLAACSGNPNCVAIDYVTDAGIQNTVCFVHTASTIDLRRQIPFVNQYIIRRCQGGSTIAPTGTPQVTSPQTVSGVQPTGVTGTTPSSQCLMFTGFGANINGGANIGRTTTLAECVGVCSSSMNCRSADHNIFDGACYTHISEQTRTRNTCCNRIEKICNSQYVCPGAVYFQRYANVRVSGGGVVNAATYTLCENACKASTLCNSFNWRVTGGQGACELITNQEERNIPNDPQWASYIKMSCASTTGVPTTTPTISFDVRYSCPATDLVVIMDGSGTAKPHWIDRILPTFLALASRLPVSTIFRISFMKFSSNAAIFVSLNRGTSFGVINTIFQTNEARNVGGGTTNLGNAFKLVETARAGEFGSQKLALLFIEGEDLDEIDHPPSFAAGVSVLRNSIDRTFVYRGSTIIDQSRSDFQLNAITGGVVTNTAASNVNTIFKPSFPSTALSTAEFNQFMDAFAINFIKCTPI